MFCTQCGNQIDQGKNFCPKCGSRIAKAPQPTPDNATLELEQAPSPTIMETRTQLMSAPSQIGETQAIRAPASENGRGINKQIVIIAAAIVVLAAGVGIYFGTDLLRTTPKQEPVAVAQSPAATIVPAAPPAEEAKTPIETKESDLWSTVQPAPPEPQSPIQVEPPKAVPKLKPKPLVPAEAPAEPRRSPSERDLQNPPPSSPPSQGRLAANPGTYETIRSTNVFAEPSSSSRVVSNIDSGIRVNVVASNAEWLEVRSRFGNPPGFIRRGDTRPVGRAD
jgi:hypothetical protein